MKQEGGLRVQSEEVRTRDFVFVCLLVGWLFFKVIREVLTFMVPFYQSRSQAMAIQLS